LNQSSGLGTDAQRQKARRGELESDKARALNNVLPGWRTGRHRLSGLADPEPVVRSLVRVFIDDGTFCPGFQCRPNRELDPRVTTLFQATLDAKVPHNYFALWMMTPVRELSGARPVDSLDETNLLLRLLTIKVGLCHAESGRVRTLGGQIGDL
jgi:hypothetical protein